MKKYLKVLLLILLIFPFRIYALDNINIDINSTNAVMVNLNNNEIIYQKDKDKEISIASMQKIMTSIVAIENIKNLDESFVIPSGMFDGLDKDLAVVGFQEGDTVTYYDLLYATLLKSGADAAYALGVQVSGSEEEFVNLMNKKAQELGMKESIFKNTSGLDAEGQHSSVNDIMILLKYALKNPEFKKIISTEYYTTTNGKFSFSGPIKRAKSNGLNYFKGGKTGFTDDAGLCLASYATEDNINYLLVTAGANKYLDDQNFLDQKKIYDYFMQNYSFLRVLNKGDFIKTIKTKYDEEIDIKADKNVDLYLNNNTFVKDLNYIYVGKEVLDKNIKKNDKIGKIIIKNKDNIIYEENVYSPITVKFKLKKIYKEIILGLVIFIFLLIIIRKIRRKRRRRRRKKHNY